MKKLIFFLSSLGVAQLWAQSADFVYAKSIGSSLVESAVDVAADTAGNAYFIGSFSGTVDMNPGSGTDNKTAVNGDAFIIKLDKFGNYVWSRILSGTSDEEAESITISKSGQIFMTVASTSATFDTDPGASTDNHTGSQFGTVYMIQLDGNGNYWNGRKTPFSRRSKIEISSKGKIIIAGALSSNQDFDPGIGTAIIPAKGGLDIGLLCLNQDASYSYGKIIGSTDDDFITDMKLDQEDNIHICGSFSGTCDMDPGAGTYNLVSEGISNAFDCKLTPEGNFSWAIQFSGPSGSICHGVVTDQNNAIYLRGNFIERIDLDPGPGKFEQTSTSYLEYLVKISASGKFIRAVPWNGPNSTLYVNNFSINSRNQLILAGRYIGKIDLDLGSDSLLIETTNFKSRGIIAVFDTQFRYQYHLGFENSKMTMLSIVSDNRDRFYVAGKYTDTCNFNPKGNATFISKGNTDAYIMKFSPWALGTEDYSTFENINIYPNPCHDYTRIALDPEFNSGQIRITDMQGRLVYYTDFTGSSNIQIPVSFSEGTYLVSITSGRKSGTYKLIKQ